MPKIHSSILYVQGQLSEKEAKEVQKSKSSTATSMAKAKTPKKMTLRKVRNLSFWNL
jgi:hypothetical protein